MGRVWTAWPPTSPLNVRREAKREGKSKAAVLKEIRFSFRDRLHAAYGLPKSL